VNQLWLVHDGRVGPFDGDLDDYTALVLASRRERSDTDERTGKPRREQRQQEAAERQRLASARKPLQNSCRSSKRSSPSDRRAARTRARLADPAFYHAGADDEVASVLKRRANSPSKWTCWSRAG